MILPISSVNYSAKQLVFGNSKTIATVDNPHSEPEKKQLSTGAKVGIALGAVALAGSGIYYLLRGKGFKLTASERAKIAELINSGEIDEKYAKFFTELLESKSLDKPEVILKKLAELFDYKVAPELVTKDLNGIDGIYSFVEGTISVPAKVSLSTMYHEFIHFTQLEKVFRAFGKDAMIDAKIESIVSNLQFDSKYKGGKLSQKYFGMPFEEVTPQELEKYISGVRAKMSSRFNEKLYTSVAESKGKLTPEDLKKAEAYLEAMKCGDANQSLIEKEAYSKQFKFDKMFKAFTSVFKNM